MEKIKWVAQINANDDIDGEEIKIGIDMDAECDELKGCRVIADNSDDVGYHAPQTEGKCREDIAAMWGGWTTFNWID